MQFKPTSPLSGFIELSPIQQKCFDECSSRMQKVLKTAGFDHLDLPSIERAEVLTDKDNWDEIETQMYMFQKGDTKMGLRYDGTVGLARYVAGRANDLVFPFRAYQFAKNYRGERPQAGRYREFYQMDMDILGINSLSLNYDAEIVAVLSKAYESCKKFIGDTYIRVGSRTFWNAMFEYLELSPEESRQAFVLIDKRDKIKDDFDPELKKVIGNKAIDIISVFSNGYEQFSNKSEKLKSAVSEIDNFMKQLSSMGIKNAKIDLGIMRGHAYYTGIVFEVFLESFPELGAVGGGGRYENLTSKFSKTKIIGVGAAVGFSRMMVSLLDKNKIDLSVFSNSKQVSLLIMDENSVVYGMKILQELRDSNITAIPFLDTDRKFKNQMEFSDKIGCLFSMIVGEDEVKTNKITVKNMKTGEQSTITLTDAIKIIEKSI